MLVCELDAEFFGPLADGEGARIRPLTCGLDAEAEADQRGHTFDLGEFAVGVCVTGSASA